MMNLFNALLLILGISFICCEGAYAQSNDVFVLEVKYAPESYTHEPYSSSEFIDWGEGFVVYFKSKKIHKGINKEISLLTQTIEKYPKKLKWPKNFSPIVMVTYMQQSKIKFVFVNQFGMVVLFDENKNESEIYEIGDEIWRILYRNVKGFEKTRKQHSSIYKKLN